MPDLELAVRLRFYLRTSPRRLDQAGISTASQLPTPLQPSEPLPDDAAMPLLLWAARMGRWWLTPNAADPRAARAHRTAHGEHIAAWDAGGRALQITDADTLELWSSTEQRALLGLDHLARGATTVPWDQVDALMAARVQPPLDLRSAA